MVRQQVLEFGTRGRSALDITAGVQAVVADSGIATGTCQVFVQHTSASLMLCENADPAVRRDLEDFLARLAPDGDPRHQHDAEGPDDMPAHIRTVLTGSTVAVPVAQGCCLLGTWQGIYLWEHRTTGARRRVVVTVQGE